MGQTCLPRNLTSRSVFARDVVQLPDLSIRLVGNVQNRFAPGPRVLASFAARWQGTNGRNARRADVIAHFLDAPVKGGSTSGDNGW